MNRNWIPATIRWLTPEEGGRRQVPEGPEYAATARFLGDRFETLFSVVIRQPNPNQNGTDRIELSVLFPENLPLVSNGCIASRSS